MAIQQAFRGSKSIAGTVLIGLGMVILYQNLTGAVGGVRHILGANGSGTLGIVLSLAQVLQAYATDHQMLLQVVFHVLLSSWPLLLVRIGTVLSQETFVQDVDVARKKDHTVVDLTAGRSTLK